jgi:hypothetical protein
VTRRGLELADIVHAHRDDFVASREGRISAAERRVLDDIAACRTASRGGHLERCDECGHQRIAYNSCRNRHCPKCQESARADWSAQREQEVLPTDYFHVIFTIPRELADIALQNKKVLYGILFRASAETLRTIAADPTHLGAEIGFVSVLHTWSQSLDHHPHIHCLVPGGGLSEDGTQWIACRPSFFLPVRVLGRLFRGKFLHYLRDAYEHGKLDFHGRLAELKDRSRFRSYLAPVFEKKWRVYSTPPFGRPEAVLCRKLNMSVFMIEEENSPKRYNNRGKTRQLVIS